MSFEELRPQPKNAKAAVPVRMGLTKSRGGRARAYLVFRKDVLAQLGGKGWRYRIALGKGENAHQVAVTQADDGPFEAADIKGAMILRLPIVERFPDEKFPTVECSYREGGGEPAADRHALVGVEDAAEDRGRAVNGLAVGSRQSAVGGAEA